MARKGGSNRISLRKLSVLCAGASGQPGAGPLSLLRVHHRRLSCFANISPLLYSLPELSDHKPPTIHREAGRQQTALCISSSLRIPVLVLALRDYVGCICKVVARAAQKAFQLCQHSSKFGRWSYHNSRCTGDLTFAITPTFTILFIIKPPKYCDKPCPDCGRQGRAKHADSPGIISMRRHGDHWAKTKQNNIAAYATISCIRRRRTSDETRKTLTLNRTNESSTNDRNPHKG